MEPACKRPAVHVPQRDAVVRAGVAGGHLEYMILCICIDIYIYIHTHMCV